MTELMYKQTRFATLWGLNYTELRKKIYYISTTETDRPPHNLDMCIGVVEKEMVGVWESSLASNAERIQG